MLKWGCSKVTPKAQPFPRVPCLAPSSSRGSQNRALQGSVGRLWGTRSHSSAAELTRGLGPGSPCGHTLWLTPLPSKQSATENLAFRVLLFHPRQSFT